ncbi:hypothetical protein AVEN_234284-1 [Araneus ventricosus]|uniref:Reverse transcriptase domain-containing protein n=1 Tax=Araneus ventricosus TaxID=182803 RepID=A0A4Y2A993_ARAVE|nr:hypothetical protein AVEN_234284-1 [Araneus ventricosus]
MPFGLRNAGQTFQRFMDEVFRGLNGYVYLDDMVVSSKDFSTHMHELRQVFQRLDQYNIVLKSRQLEFLAQFSTDIRHVSGDSNAVPDALSRIDEIHLLVKIYFDTMAKDQESNNRLESLMRIGSGLKLKPIKLSSRAKLMCDVSTGTIRPYVPETFRKIAFDSIHSLFILVVKPLSN